MSGHLRPGLAAIAAAAIAVLFAGALAGVLELAGLRIAGSVALVLTLAALWDRRDPRLVIAPMLPLAAVAIVLVLVMPGLLPRGFFGPIIRDFYGRAMTQEPVKAARLVAGFGALSLAVLLTVGLWWSRRVAEWVKVRPVELRFQLAIAAVVAAAAIVYVLGYRPGTLVAFSGFGTAIPNGVYEAITPLLCLAVAFFAVQSTATPRSVLLFLLAAAVLVLALAATLTIRNALMMIVAAGVLLVGLPGRISRRAIAGGLLLALLAGGVATWGIFKVRYADGGIEVSASEILRVKVAERFTVTFSCLAGAMAVTQNLEPPQPPYYFLTGLVPRAVWPDKPTLSRGDYYSEAYCGILLEPGRPGSMSITLTGEPLVEAGWRGIVAAAVAWVVLTIGFTWVCMRMAVPGAAWMAAMIPWLADFDQSFTLYLAQGVKSALIMAPLVLVWWWWNERSEGA